MKISPEEITHVAKLAHLSLSPAEVESMTEQLGRILQYMTKLTELDTEGVQPTTHAISIRNAFREDVVTGSLEQESALANGPRQNGEAFVVPKVI